jgi:hypothetical protein
MIQITGIPKLRRWKPSPANFIDCARCGVNYQPTYRSIFCPHALSSPTRLLGTGSHAALVPAKPKKQSTPALVLEEPFWDQQKNETRAEFELYLYYEGLGARRTVIAVARHFQKTDKVQGGQQAGLKVPINYAYYRKVCEKNKWDVRVAAREREDDRIRNRLMREHHKKRVLADLAVIDAGRQAVASELRDTLAELQAQGKRLDLPLDVLMATYEKITKLERLLMGESTENIVTDTPDMIRERKLRDAVNHV